MAPAQHEPDPSGWERWPGISCYDGRGGVQMTGFDPAPSADAGSTLAECMDLCARTSGCDGVQSEDPFSDCFLRTEVNVLDCIDDQGWDMYTPISHDSLIFMIIAIIASLLCIVAIALAVYYLWRKKLLCFKPKVELSDAEAESFNAKDQDGDDVITEAEFAQFRQERQCGRSCNTCWAGGED